MKIAVLNSKGKETGREVTLPKEIFSIEPNEHALYLDVKQYLLIRDKVLTKQKKELILLEVLERSKDKKVQVQPGQVVLNQVSSEEEVEYLVLDLEIMK